MKILALLLCLALAAPALAQPQWRRDGPRQGEMREEERQRMREQMREVYRDRGERRPREERPRSMSPEERAKLRRDIENANRELRRK